MNIEELNNRIEKKENQIKKIEKRITKWSKGMPQDAINKCAACEVTFNDPKYNEVRKEWKEFKDANIQTRENELFNHDEYNKGPNYDELYSAYRDLAEAKETLKKYQNQVSKIQEFESEEKINIIWDFLQNWKKEVTEFVIENAKEYYNLKKHEDEEFENYVKSLNLDETDYRHEVNSYRRLLKFRESYYSDISSLTRLVYSYAGSVDEIKLENYLTKEVENKYKRFISSIEEKAGNILDVSDLSIGAKGELNGIVVGDKNKVRVETIGAGGYNIQVYHFRTLINVIK